MTPQDDVPPPAPLPRVVPRHIQIRWLAAVAAALVLVFAVAAFWRSGSSTSAPQGAQGRATTFRPTAQQLKTLTIEPVVLHRFAPVEVADGRIAVNGDRTTAVYSPYSGRVVEVLAHPSDRVTEGGTLAIIEASETADAQSSFRAALGQQRLAHAADERKRALLAVNGASQQEAQQAAADLASAEAALSAARSHLQILGQSPAAIEALAAGGPADARTALRSPIAGVVVDRQLGPGQYLTAASGIAVYSVADLRSVWVVGTLSERTTPRIRRGQSVSVTTAAWPGRTFTTHLDYVAAGIDPATHRLNVRATIDNADGALRPEMLATLRIEAGDAKQAPAVAAEAVLYEGDRAHVWVAAADGSIALRELRVGLAGDGLVEVVEGLTVGERVVTRGGLFVDRAARLE